jgi:hypothetical protein
VAPRAAPAGHFCIDANPSQLLPDSALIEGIVQAAGF